MNKPSNTLQPLPPLLAKIAKEELNEDESRLQDDIEALRSWMIKQPHLRGRTESSFLVGFLRGSKFSLEKAKKKIDFYYTMRDLVPEIFRNRSAVDARTHDILRLGAALHFPRPISEAGPRVIMLRLGCFDLHKYTTYEIIKAAVMICEILLYEDFNVVIAGYILIMDLANITPFQIFHFDAVLIKKLTIMANKALPSRMKGFHFVNVLPSFEKFFNMVKSVINEKLQNRFYVHNKKLETLYEYIPKECLPKEYGGTDGTIDDILTYWIERLKKTQDFFDEEETFGTNEAKRKGNPMNSETLFGIDGSFRKLNVD